MGLGIKIDQADALALSRECGAQVDGRRGFSDSAFLVNEGYDFCHPGSRILTFYKINFKNDTPDYFSEMNIGPQLIRWPAASQNFTTGHFSLIILHSLTLDYFFSRLYNTRLGGGTPALNSLRELVRGKLAGNSLTIYRNCLSGGIGIRVRLKIVWEQSHVGSTPTSGTYRILRVFTP